MGIDTIIKNLFNKKSNLNIELKLTEEVIEHNITEDILDIHAKIIEYHVNIDSEENDIPSIIFICDFHCSIMPDIGSIIWCPNKDMNKLEPYKVLRFDFIEDLNTDLNKNTFIVVKPAIQTDII